MKKMISVFLMIFILSSVIPCVYAETEKGFEVKKPDGGLLVTSEVVGTRYADEGISLFSDPQMGIEEYLKEQIRNRVADISIYEAGYLYEPDELNYIINRMIFTDYTMLVYPDFDHTEIILQHSLGDEERYVYEYYPAYMFSTYEEDEDAIDYMDNGIEQYLNAAENIPDDDIVGKLLVIYDKFCRDSEYAQTELEDEYYSGVPDFFIRTPYCYFLRHRAVCQGNTIALNAIIEALNDRLTESLPPTSSQGTSNTSGGTAAGTSGGTATGGTKLIETAIVSSETLNHMWNAVKIYGKWYFIDETWDDPTVNNGSAVLTECFHNYFLVPYSSMQDHLYDSLNDVYFSPDWEFYTYSSNVGLTSFYDTTYLSGHIFNGSFRHNGNNLGTYYGNISYASGMYMIEVFAKYDYYAADDDYYIYPSNVSKPFLSSSIISPGIIATNPFKEGSYKKIAIFSTEGCSSPLRDYIVTYSNGKVTSVFSDILLNSIQECEVRKIPYQMTVAESDIYIWKDGTQIPLCRKVHLPLVVNN